MTRRLFLFAFSLLLATVSLGARGFDADRIVMTIDSRAIPAGEFFYLYGKNVPDSSAVGSPRDYAGMFAVFKMKVMEAEACGIDTLPEFRREYESYVASIDTADRLLRQEYREGMLLFEISDRRVWRKSVADTDALAGIFARNRDKYAWDRPRAKGWIIYADSHDIACDACSYLDSLGTCPPDVRGELAPRFGRSLTAVKYLVARGANPLVDSLVFGSGTETRPDNGWALAVPYAFRVIDQPEEWLDVKGPVTTDYQEELNSRWESELWNSHTVVINYDTIDEMARML